jgi:hypothetical protein
MKTLLTYARNAAIAFVAVTAVAFISPVRANDTKPQAVELKYLGQFQNHPVFELNFASEKDTEFTVIIRDDQNNVVYKDFVKAGTVSKKYLLNTEEVGDVPLQFEITGKQSAKTVIYEINKSTRTIDDVVVNKLK